MRWVDLVSGGGSAVGEDEVLEAADAAGGLEGGGMDSGLVKFLSRLPRERGKKRLPTFILRKLFQLAASDVKLR